MTTKPIIHGRVSSYTRRGCRCHDCTTAASADVMARNERSKATGFAGRTHGLIGTYSSGCRCDECREARRLYVKINPHQQAERMAASRAAKWMRDHHPGEWRILINEARAELQELNEVAA